MQGHGSQPSAASAGPRGCRAGRIRVRPVQPGVRCRTDGAAGTTPGGFASANGRIDAPGDL